MRLFLTAQLEVGWHNGYLQEKFVSFGPLASPLSFSPTFLPAPAASFIESLGLRQVDPDRHLTPWGVSL